MYKNDLWFDGPRVTWTDDERKSELYMLNYTVLSVITFTLFWNFLSPYLSYIYNLYISKSLHRALFEEFLPALFYTTTVAAAAAVVVVVVVLFF